MQVQNGLALADIVTEAHFAVLKSERVPFFVQVVAVDLSDAIQAALEVQLADIEYRLTLGASDKMQLGALIAAFTYARQMTSDELKKKNKTN